MRTVVVAGGGAAWEPAVIDEITRSETLHLHRRCLDVAELLSLADHCDVAVVSTDLSGLDVDTVLTLERHGVRVVGVGDGERGRQLGMSVLAHPRDLESSLAAPVRVEPSPAGESSAGRLVAVWGPHGAPGRSIVAASLAAAWASAGQSVTLVDADARGGALAQMFAVLDDASGLVAACRGANRGDRASVVDHTVLVEPGLRLLTGVSRAEMWSQVRDGPFELVLRELLESNDSVVVDLGPGLDPQTTHVLEAAEQVIVVGRADPVGLARLIRQLHELGALRPTTDARCVVVVNQMRTTSAWTERDVGDAVTRLAGTRPDVFLPADFKTLDTAILRGVMPSQVAPNSPFAAAIGKLVDHVAMVGA